MGFWIRMKISFILDKNVFSIFEREILVIVHESICWRKKVVGMYIYIFSFTFHIDICDFELKPLEWHSCNPYIFYTTVEPKLWKLFFLFLFVHYLMKVSTFCFMNYIQGIHFQSILILICLYYSIIFLHPSTVRFI